MPLRLTRRAAASEVALALELRRRLPGVWEALAAGRIDVRRARVMADGTSHLSIAQARSVIHQVGEDAGLLTTGQLAARLRRLAIEVDPDDAERRFEHAVDDRRVVVEPTSDGTAHLFGLDLPPQRVTVVMDRINRFARSLRGGAETRTMDQLRADILLDLLEGTTHAGRGGVVDIQVDLETLAQLVNTPGELAGYGPVIADIARQVTTDQPRAEWHYTVTDPSTSHPVHTGTTRRRPTANQRRDVETRDRTCVFLGCRMPATRSDIDHRILWSEGGPTHVGYLAPLCSHDHHRVRHHIGRTYQPLPSGDYQWTSPLDHSYTTSGKPP